MHYNYICHFLVVKKTMLEKVGDFNPCYDGAQDYELVLRLTEQTDAIYHIRKILYHWRIHSGSTAGSSLSKDYAYDAGKHWKLTCRGGKSRQRLKKPRGIILMK